jgi:hypothetical protein
MELRQPCGINRFALERHAVGHLPGNGLSDWQRWRRDSSCSMRLRERPRWPARSFGHGSFFSAGNSVLPPRGCDEPAGLPVGGYGF